MARPNHSQSKESIQGAPSKSLRIDKLKCENENFTLLYLSIGILACSTRGRRTDRADQPGRPPHAAGLCARASGGPRRQDPFIHRNGASNPGAWTVCTRAVVRRHPRCRRAHPSASRVGGTRRHKAQGARPTTAFRIGAKPHCQKTPWLEWKTD